MGDRVGWGEGRDPPKFLTSIKNCKMAEKVSIQLTIIQICFNETQYILSDMELDCTMAFSLNDMFYQNLIYMPWGNSQNSPNLQPCVPNWVGKSKSDMSNSTIL